MEKSSIYYTTIKHMINIYHDQGRKLAFKAETVSEYEDWKKIVREKLIDISGISKMKSGSLCCELISSEKMDGYRRDKVLLETCSEVWMPMYILIPDQISKNKKPPCIIAVHGHGGAGKESIAGNRQRDDVSERIDFYNYDYGLKFVKQGYVVFCPDARGSGERRETLQQGEETENVLNSSCYDLNNAAISMGQSLLGMWTWDLMRLIDYIETLNYCDGKAIACCGFSGGGLQTLWLSALEDRISCAIISGYFHSFKDAILRTNHCGCNFVPHLWENVDIGDMGAIIAPKPLLIESGNQDPLNGERGIKDVYEQVEITRAAYRLCRVEDNLHHHVFSGGHLWNGDKSIKFLEKYLNRGEFK